MIDFIAILLGMLDGGGAGQTTHGLNADDRLLALRR